MQLCKHWSLRLSEGRYFFTHDCPWFEGAVCFGLFICNVIVNLGVKEYHKLRKNWLNSVINYSPLLPFASSLYEIHFARIWAIISTTIKPNSNEGCSRYQVLCEKQAKNDFRWYYPKTGSDSLVTCGKVSWVRLMNALKWTKNKPSTAFCHYFHTPCVAFRQFHCSC